jgi:hypothetical protein
MRDDFSRQTDANRILRDARLANDRARLGRSFAAGGRGTPRFVGQVFDGGSMPRRLESVYLLHPIVLEGPESEGAAAAIRVDTGRSVPVVVIGSRQPVAGDVLIAHSLGGRWVADGGINNFPNCNPQSSACPGIRYAVNGTVDDPVNGTQPLVYDFVHNAWYSAWLPVTSPYVLTSSIGQSPCTVGSGVSYYFYKLAFSNPPSGQVVASLFLPGQGCLDAGGNLTNAFFNYAGASYPALLGSPATALIPGFTFPSIAPATPGSCDPLTYNAVWGTAGRLPFTSSTYTIPRFIAPGFGYSCATPCPLPRKNLTLTWVGTGGNGSGTLVWSDQTQDWNLACANGVAVRIFITSSNALGFSATAWDGPGCSGTAHPVSYPSSIGLTAFTCEPLYLAFKILYASSPLYTKGYRSFVVTE